MPTAGFGALGAERLLIIDDHRIHDDSVVRVMPALISFASLFKHWWIVAGLGLNNVNLVLRHMLGCHRKLTALHTAGGSGPGRWMAITLRRGRGLGVRPLPLSIAQPAVSLM